MQQSMRRHVTPPQCIHDRPPADARRRSVPASQPPYPIDRIKSLAGDVIVFGALPLIILWPRAASPAPPRSHCVCRAVAVYRLPDVARRSSLSVCLSVLLRSLLPARSVPDNEPVFYGKCKADEEMGDELERCWPSRAADLIAARYPRHSYL